MYKSKTNLAEAFPTVAATWHPERNGHRQTPATIPPKVADLVWWRCPAGHEWRERVATRTALPKWKKGDVAACRACVEPEKVAVEHTCSDCGRVSKMLTRTLNRGETRCWYCRVEADGTSF